MPPGSRSAVLEPDRLRQPGRPARYLRDIRATGARWVTFTPTWYQMRASTDSGPHHGGDRERREPPRRIVARAHEAGLKE
ncbi:hypothetical protein ACRAWF_42115 [Streptomyces sp. L7]